MRNILCAIIAALGISSQAQQLLWTDTNLTSAEVIRYVVYEDQTDTVLATVDDAKTTDDPKEIILNIGREFAGKAVTVTAISRLGLESERYTPALVLPTLPEKPSEVRLAWDFANHWLEIIWSSTDTTGDIKNFKVVRVNRTTGANEEVAVVGADVDRVSIEMPIHRETYGVASIGYWGESEFEFIETPTVVVPVTNLRIAP